MQEYKGIKSESIISALAFIIFGGILLLFPETTAKTICYTIGIVVAAIGIIKLLSYFLRDAKNSVGSNNLIIGSIVVLIGLFIIIGVRLIISIIPFMLGVMICISGVGKLQATFDVRKMKNEKWTTMLIVSLINILLGVILIFRPFKAASLMFRLVGLVMIFSGGTDLFNTIYVSRKFKEYCKDMEALEQDAKFKD